MLSVRLTSQRLIVESDEDLLFVVEKIESDFSHDVRVTARLVGSSKVTLQVQFYVTTDYAIKLGDTVPLEFLSR